VPPRISFEGQQSPALGAHDYAQELRGMQPAALGPGNVHVPSPSYGDGSQQTYQPHHTGIVLKSPFGIGNTPHAFSEADPHWQPNQTYQPHGSRNSRVPHDHAQLSQLEYMQTISPKYNNSPMLHQVSVEPGSLQPL
jgi:hypothetical protein